MKYGEESRGLGRAMMNFPSRPGGSGGQEKRKEGRC
jgi:hypothetical protein